MRKILIVLLCCIFLPLPALAIDPYPGHATGAEIDQLQGVTGNVQQQLNNKLNVSDAGVIPEGTDPPTAAGRIVHDTNAGQLLVGNVPMVFHPADWKNTYIDNFDENVDSYEIFRAANFPVTITHIGVNCEGSCSTPGTFAFADNTGNALTVGSITVATGSGAVSFAPVSAGGSLVSGEGVEVTTTNTPTAGDKYGFHIVYKVDRQ